MLPDLKKGFKYQYIRCHMLWPITCKPQNTVLSELCQVYFPPLLFSRELKVIYMGVIRFDWPCEASQAEIQRYSHNLTKIFTTGWGNQLSLPAEMAPCLDTPPKQERVMLLNNLKLLTLKINWRLITIKFFRLKGHEGISDN